MAEEATLSDAEGKVNETEAFIDQLTAGRRNKRQAATSCGQIADLIDVMKEAVEQGDIMGMVRAAVRIMTSGITGCSAADRELVIKKKMKIQDCKGRVRERIVTIKIKIKIKREKIKKIKEKKEGILQEINQRPTRPPKPAGGSYKPNSIESTPVAFGSKPSKPSGTRPPKPTDGQNQPSPIESTPIAFGSKPTKPYGTRPPKPSPIESTPVAFG